MTISSYRDLDTWKVGIMVARAAYFVTNAFPREEVFGLTSQIRRSAASIAANIAEGHGRESTGDFVRSLRIAQGSLKELETHVHIAVEVNIASAEQVAELLDLCDRQGRLIRALIRSLQAKDEA